MNIQGVLAIYYYEMSRFKRTVGQSIASPVLSTSLYFIVPGLIMLSVLTQSISNASFGIYFPRFSGSIYEVLSAPLSYFEVVLGYVGAAATKSFILGVLILCTAFFFVDLQIQKPIWMMLFLLLTCITFSLFGFIIGIWADGFEKLQIIPLLIITPLTFLGGSFYSINMLPEFWQKVSLLNPVVYLISGFRWAFYGKGDVSIYVSIGMVCFFLTSCIVILRYIFKTGYRIKS
jgi:ABC-2 type transport system permease protein